VNILSLQEKQDVFSLPTNFLHKLKPVLLKSSVLTPLDFLWMLNSAIYFLPNAD